MTRRHLFTGYLLVWALLLAGCMAEGTPVPAFHLTLVGSDSMQWLARALGSAYTQQHPNVIVTVQASNSELGLRAASEYTRTVGMVSRAIDPNELDQLRAVVVARDGVAVIVNDKNPISAIQKAQVTQVFSGDILTWPTGPDKGKPIVVISREAGSGTRNAFEALAMNKRRVTLTALIMPSEAAVADYVLQHSEAIGYTSMGGVIAGTHALVIDDVALSTQSVESQKYSLVRTLAFVVPAQAQPEIQGFCDFAVSPEGQAIVGQRFGRAPPNP